MSQSRSSAITRNASSCDFTQDEALDVRAKNGRFMLSEVEA
jgi:hypothetical protein